MGGGGENGVTVGRKSYVCFCSEGAIKSKAPWKRGSSVSIKSPDSWDGYCALNEETFIRGIQIETRII